MIVFYALLIIYTHYEDKRDSFWFYGTAGRGKKDPHNIYWHKIKHHEAIFGWLTGASGVVWLYFTWTGTAASGGWITSTIFIFITLVVMWCVRVKLHLYFLRNFKLKLRRTL